MKSNYNRIGDFIRLVDERNTGLKVKELLGLTISKQFIPSVANIIGSDMENYKIIRKNQFACSTMQVRRDKKMPVALLKDKEEAIISQAYPVFEIIDVKKLLPEYLMMWFSRSEFDREACFHAVGGVRGSLEWDDFCNMKLPVPSLEKQKEIVKEYNVILNRIQLNNQLIQKLEETAQAIYKQWFVEFEFPCLPSDYRPKGQVNLSDMMKICTYKRVGGLPLPDGSSWFVYVLLCEDGSFYKGMTNDLYFRFYQHYIGEGADWTKTHKPIKVIHYETFQSKEEAARREKDLKTGFGRTWLKREYQKIGLPAHQCKLMQAGKMIDSEMGKIPEGWKVGKISDIISVKDGTHDSPKPIEKGYPLVTSTNLKSYEINFDNTYNISQKDFHKANTRSKVDKYDILLSMIGTVGMITYILYDKINFAVKNVGLFKTSEKENIAEYILFFLKSNNFINHIQTNLLGSTQNYVTLNFLRIIPILIPADKNILNFKRYSQKIIEHIYLKINEKNMLSELKSLLLSKLATEGGG